MRALRYLCALALASAVAGGAAAARATSTGRVAYKKCPVSAVSSYDAGSMVDGAWRSIPRIFAPMNYVMGRAEPVTRINTVVLGAYNLSPINRGPEVVRLRKDASAACGAAIAGRSWALRLYFSESPVYTTAVAWVTRARGRWVIWMARG